MKIIMGDDISERELDRMATAYLRRMAWRKEARWHPSLFNRQKVVGFEHVLRALEAGKGCILSFAHHGDWEGMFPSVARCGVGVQVLAASVMFEAKQPLWLRQQALMIESADNTHLLDVAGGSTVVRELLRRHQLVAIALDVPGHTRYSFLGREMLLSSGGSRIAVETGSPVVVATQRRPEPGGWSLGATVVLHPPLWPDDFGSVHELALEMSSRHERAILAWPAGVDEPARLLDLSLVRQSTEYRPTA